MIKTHAQATEKYQFLGIVDKPKAGVTYKVRNLETGELEVLRTLPGAVRKDSETRERFLREIRIHARLSHPNVVAFHDAWELDGELVMTSEFVEGVSLASQCAAGPLPVTDAVREICAVLSGLEEAHELGIVHRGITADHVTVTASGEVKLGGFGLAKPACDVQLTQTGAILGDPAYVSPEQVSGESAADIRSDLYSVGVLLYLALTGTVPFRGANEFDVLAAHLGSVPAPPSSINPAVAAELDAVVVTALAKRPAQRYANARQFRTALASAVSVQTPRNQEARLPSPAAPRSRVALWCGGALLLVIVWLVIHFLGVHA